MKAYAQCFADTGCMDDDVITQCKSALTQTSSWTCNVEATCNPPPAGGEGDGGPGLVIGLGVGIGVVVLIGIAVVAIVFRAKRSRSRAEGGGKPKRGFQQQSVTRNGGGLPTAGGRPDIQNPMSPLGGIELRRGADLQPQKAPNSTAGLPPGWRSAQDAQSGEHYYFNEATGETKWNKPADAAAGSTTTIKAE